ncbi:Hypothetical protein, putative [Bodo saltans]|uniref:Uncharacterized protein n=1 Tax=Bodo saltans TaxID=75058 RepID=A0A0S4IQA1_BODSA|nr:Hypothetical protein, putative [Bodo saltans]|eukprot:CUE84410.1 Hypothetical protein, putative [Bodo saltans]
MSLRADSTVDLVPVHYEEQLDAAEVDEEWIRGGAPSSRYGGGGYESDSSFLAWANRTDLRNGHHGSTPVTGRPRSTTTNEQSADESDRDGGSRPGGGGGAHSRTNSISDSLPVGGWALSPLTITGGGGGINQQHYSSSSAGGNHSNTRGEGGASHHRQRSSDDSKQQQRRQQRAAKELDDLFSYVSAPDDDDDDDERPMTTTNIAVPAHYQQHQQQSSTESQQQRHRQQQPQQQSSSSSSHIVNTPRSVGGDLPPHSPTSSQLRSQKQAQQQQQQHHHQQQRPTSSSRQQAPPRSPKWNPANAQNAAASAASSSTFGEDPQGFNDPRLLKLLQDKINDRSVLEQLLVLQDEAHSAADLMAILPTAFRRLIFAQAFAFDVLEIERLQKATLDELLVEYTSSNFVPEVRGALMQKIEIASMELAEIEDAVRAVDARTEEESMQAEDALVDLLTSIRSERTILMDQLQIAEEQRRRAFLNDRDKQIDKNFVLPAAAAAAVAQPPPMQRSSSQFMNNTKSSSVMTTASTATSTAAPPNASHGGSVFPMTSTAPTVLRDRAIPRDLWVSKTLPTARRVASFRQEHPAGLEGRLGSFRSEGDLDSGHHSSIQPHDKHQQKLYHEAATSNSKKYIDAAFPMPPLREDLEDIQRATAVLPTTKSSNLADAFSSALDHRQQRIHAAATTGSTGGGLRAAPVMHLDGPEDKQKSAAFYHTFLAAAASPKQKPSSSASAQQHTGRDTVHQGHSYDDALQSSPIAFNATNQQQTSSSGRHELQLSSDSLSHQQLARNQSHSVDEVLKALSKSLVDSGTAVRRQN